jgi:hypothetical protein
LNVLFLPGTGHTSNERDEPSYNAQPGPCPGGIDISTFTRQKISTSWMIRMGFIDSENSDFLDSGEDAKMNDADNFVTYASSDLVDDTDMPANDSNNPISALTIPTPSTTPIPTTRLPTSLILLVS